MLEYRTLLGCDAGCAANRDDRLQADGDGQPARCRVVVVLLGYLLVMSTLLYSQDIPIVAYLLLVIVVMLAAQVLIHRQHSGLSTPTLPANEWADGAAGDSYHAYSVRTVSAHPRPAGPAQGCL